MRLTRLTTLTKTTILLTATLALALLVAVPAVAQDVPILVPDNSAPLAFGAPGDFALLVTVEAYRVTDASEIEITVSSEVRGVEAYLCGDNTDRRCIGATRRLGDQAILNGRTTATGERVFSHLSNVGD